MNANIFAKANHIIKTCNEAYLGVIDENGFPHVSTVSTIKPEDIFTAYFATGMNSNKTNVCSATSGQASVTARTATISLLSAKRKYSPTKKQKPSVGWIGSLTIFPAVKPTRITAS